MVATGPRPGSTPINVPSTEPKKAYSRFWRVNATPKPSARLCIRSMSCSSGGDERRPHRDGELQPHDEDEPGGDGQDDGVDEHVAPVELVAREARDGDQDRDRDDHPEPGDGGAEHRDRRHD